MEPMKPMKPMEPMKPMSPMAPMKPMAPAERWWPSHLGEPNSAGGQNEMRYAYFSADRRLAVQRNGKTTLYDTGNHHIGGVAQQQSNGENGATFTSQDGNVRLEDLKVVER
jgi:hypothetical protein